jgi:antitoxin (DNA-binding transcriptional repressor) of toxin-antitoxin stability system
VLDATEQGETIVVTRSGRRVALIAPAPRANGGALLDVVDRWRGHAALDDAFAAQVARVRGSVSAELDTDPWRD